MVFKKVICSSCDKFRDELLKQAAAGHNSIIRGRSIYVYGHVVAELVL